MYHEAFIFSNSDFWWEGVRKKNFGACIANFMMNRYRFRNGTSLFMSNSTLMSDGGKVKDALVNSKPHIDRCSSLLDFCNFEEEKSGTNIGSWLERIHRGAGAKPSFIGSHTVDGAGNAVKSAETLELTTSENRSQKMVTDRCDAHKVNTTSSQASGMSYHVDNLNPAMGTALTLLHESLVRTSGSGTRKKVLANVQSEHGREKTPAIKFAVKTRWNSFYDETKCANSNQLDLDIALQRMISRNGADHDLFIEYENNLGAVIPQENDWEMYQQYEGAMLPLRNLSLLMQSSKPIAHLELFEAKRALELLKAPWFLMYENKSKMTGPNGTKDLVDRGEMNQFVRLNSFALWDGKHGDVYDEMDEHEMLKEVAVTRRLGWRLLALRLNFVKRVNTLQGRSDRELDLRIGSSIMSGLEHVPMLTPLKAMGAILNPLLQNGARMVDAGVMTQEQYDVGLEELLDRMTRYHERHQEEVAAARSQKTNKWSILHNPATTSSARKKAEAEFQRYLAFNDIQYLPEMKPNKVLGAIDDHGQPKEPVYCIGPVTERGSLLPSGRNHADYIDKTGYYDLGQYLVDHKEEKYFPAIASVGNGECLAHTTAEVDCESLFSQAGYLSQPKRAQTNVRKYERLVVSKHRLGRIYCSREKVHRKFMERFKSNNWAEEDERDDKAYLELEKEIYLEQYPWNASMFEEEDTEKDDDKSKTESCGCDLDEKSIESISSGSESGSESESESESESDNESNKDMSDESDHENDSDNESMKS